MPFTQNVNARIHYKVVGTGDPLVLIHGTTGCLEDWIDFGYVSELKKHFQCILIDLRGHGDSEKFLDPNAYSLKHHVDDIKAVIDELNIGKAHFAGYSRGGWISFGIGKYMPERCLSIIAGGAQPYSTSKAVEKIAEVFEHGMQGFIDYSESHFGPTPEPRRSRLLATDPAPIRASTLRPRENISNDLIQFKMPMLFYCGSSDPIYSQVKKAASLVPHASFITLNGMDHMQAMEKSEHVAPHFITFFKQHLALS